MKLTQKIYNLLINKQKRNSRELGNYIIFFMKIDKITFTFNYRGGLCLSLCNRDDRQKTKHIPPALQSAGLFFHFSRSLGVFVCYN